MSTHTENVSVDIKTFGSGWFQCFPSVRLPVLFVWTLYSSKWGEKGTSKKAYCKTINTEEDRDQRIKADCVNAFLIQIKVTKAFWKHVWPFFTTHLIFWMLQPPATTYIFSLCVTIFTRAIDTIFGGVGFIVAGNWTNSNVCIEDSFPDGNISVPLTLSLSKFSGFPCSNFSCIINDY